MLFNIDIFKIVFRPVSCEYMVISIPIINMGKVIMSGMILNLASILAEKASKNIKLNNNPKG
jgi:hypothetical protein